MLSLYALGRLIWRPMSLVLLFPLVLAAAVPFLWTSGGDLNTVETTVPMIRALWRQSVMFAALGIFSALYAREFRQGLFTWTLPRLDRQLLQGMVLLAAVFLIPYGIAVANVIGFRMATAAMGSGLLFFAVGTELQDQIHSANYRRVLLAAIVVILWKIDYLYQVASIAPIEFAVVTAGVCVVLLRRGSSAEMSRQRPFTPDNAFGIGSSEALRTYWQKRSTNERQWIRPIRHDSIRDWVSAVRYESYNPRGGEWLRASITQVAFGAVIAYLSNSAPLIVLIAGGAFTFGGLQPRMNYLYPVSRQQRARIMYFSSLLETVVICALCAVFAGLLFSVGPSPLKYLHDERTFTPVALIQLVAFAFAFAPIAQWAKVYGVITPVSGLSQPRWQLIFGCQLIYMLIAAGLAAFIAKRETSAPLIWVAALGISAIVQTLFWNALKWRFARANLVTAV